MWNWFGGSGAQKAKDSPKKAILGLRSQLDMLQKREKHLQNQIDDQDQIARKNVNTNKTAAKNALRRKKAHETSMEQTVRQITTLEEQINAIESANINRETLAAMENASNAMGHIYKNLTPEKVDETMDKLRDHNQMNDEIVAAITNSTERYDEDELDEELDQLQQEMVDEQMLNTGSVPVSDAVHKMPSVANTEPVPQKAQAVADDDDAELEQLRREMAM